LLRKIFEGSGCLGYYIRRKLMICKILSSIVWVLKSRRVVQQGQEDEYRILMGKSLERGHLKA
jgi:hypothetical protein